MNELSDFVKVRYLIQTPDATLVQTAISTDSILQLTGEATRPITIYVEDKLSSAIINQLCLTLNCKRYVHTFLFGPAINSFTIIAGKVLNNELSNTTAAVLDGDMFKTEQEKSDRIKKVVTGQGYNAQRQQVLEAILQYQLPQDKNPEAYIRDSILALPNNILADEDEIRIVLNEIGIVDDKHDYIDDAIKRLDMDYQVGLSKMVALFAETKQWDNFIKQIRNWLELALKNM